MEDKISAEDLVRIYNIEVHFLNSLEEYGLVNTFVENNIKYIYYEELPNFERFANWHYDLEVNLPGLEIIHNLLKKLDVMLEENRNLVQYKNRMI